MKSILSACAILLAICATSAQAFTLAAARPLTVITVYSEQRSTDPLRDQGKAAAASPPIRVVDGGVRDAGGTCFDLDEAGNITQAPGQCVVLRSAEPGERPPGR